MAKNSIPQLLVHSPADNVGVVVVEGLQAGTNMLCVITENNEAFKDRKSTRLNSSHGKLSRMPSSA